jgi:hypothetical protein
MYGTVAVEMDGWWQCTGTLVAPQVVTTAAHCVVDWGSNVVPPSRMSIAANTMDGNLVNPANRVQASEVHMHPNYVGVGSSGWGDPAGLGADNDIGIIVLAAPVQNQTPAPVLPREVFDQYVPANAEVIISGYGVSNMATQAAGPLLIGTNRFERRNETEFLLRPITGKMDTCQGDSGGPVYVLIEGRAWVFGITSRSSGDSWEDCGGGGLYTWTPGYNDWITEMAHGLYTPSPAPGVDPVPPPDPPPDPGPDPVPPAEEPRVGEAPLPPPGQPIDPPPDYVPPDPGAPVGGIGGAPGAGGTGGGVAPAEENSPNDESCGCRLVGSSTDPSAAWLVIAAGMFLRLFRRRR